MSVTRHNREFENEKDNLIGNLRKQIFDLEQNEKSYSILNSKYKNLQNDFNLLSEANLKQEYEFKQRLETATKEIFELRSEAESIQQTLFERVNLNKKLFQDNTALHKLTEEKSAENAELRAQLSDARSNIESLGLVKSNLEKQLQQAFGDLSNQKDYSEKLIDDNEKLSLIVDQDEATIRNLESDKRKMTNKVDELTFENKGLSAKLNSREDNLAQTNKKLDEANKNLNQLETKQIDLEKANERAKVEISNLAKDLNTERNSKADLERLIERQETSIREKEKDLRNSAVDLDSLKSHNNALIEDKSRQGAEIEKLKQHIIVLTEQNQGYSEELENFLVQDEKLRQQLSSRREQSEFVLRSSKQFADKSVKSLDNHFSKSARIASPSRYPSAKATKA